MSIEIRMPELTADMTEADVVDWLVAEGEAVEAGQVIAELETEKSTVELEAPAAGTLAEIRVPGGTAGVAVGTVLAVLEPAEAGAGAQPPPGERAAPPEKAARPSPPPPPAEPPPAGSPPEGAAAAAPAGATPLASRLAEQAGLDVGAIEGSGARGRVVKADVEAALAQPGRGARTEERRPRLVVEAPEGTAPYVEIAPSRMRRVIAERLSEAKRSVPHFYLRVECEIDALLDVRRRLNEAEDAPRISLNDFVIRAAALALREVPDANVSWVDGTLRRFERVDVSVAVATEGGLVTPVVRGAERKGLAAIAVEMRDLAERARARKLAPEEYRGGTFSVSNLGMYGVEAVYPILNPPEACILGVGAAERRPVVRGDDLAAATVVTLTLSADHRAVDGALGARLLDAIRRRLEDPLAMVL